MSNIKIYKMSDYDWFVGESLEDCKEMAVKDFDYDLDGNSFDDPREITETEMDTLIFIEDDGDGYPDGTRKTFRQKLNEMIEEGASFPDLFATTEY